MKKLDELSIFELLNELLRKGAAGISLAEPFSVTDIVQNLEYKTGEKFGEDIDRWITWFCSDRAKFSDNDKEAIQIIKRLVDAEDKYIPQIRD